MGVPVATVGGYVAESPCFHRGAVSWSRHRNEGGLFPQAGIGAAAQTPRQSGALGHEATSHWPVSGSPTGHSWPSITTRVCHALVRQGHAASLSDTTHPAQHKLLLSKRREKHSDLASLTNELLGLFKKLKVAWDYFSRLKLRVYSIIAENALIQHTVPQSA